MIWSNSKRKCGSGFYRHLICIFGIEDLASLNKSRALFANKMIPSFDYTVIGCWANALYNRTYELSNVEINTEYYKNRLPVKFHNERERWRKHLSAFKCS